MIDGEGKIVKFREECSLSSVTVYDGVPEGRFYGPEIYLLCLATQVGID